MNETAMTGENDENNAQDEEEEEDKADVVIKPPSNEF